MKASEYLRAGRDRLAEGWCQGRAQDMDGNVCAYGALGAVCRSRAHIITADDYGNGQTAVFALEKYAKDLGFSSVVTMNDDPSTTQQDMLDLLEKTAIALEEVGE